MPNRLRHILVITALVLAASALSGCGTINEKLANGAGDILSLPSRWCDTHRDRFANIADFAGRQRRLF